VLADAQRDERLARLGLEVLRTLALSHGVQGQHHVPFEHQSQAGLVIQHGGLAVRGVTASEQHTRLRKQPVLRHIDVGRAVVVRLALKDQFLDDVVRMVQRADDPGVEWALLAEVTQNLRKQVPGPLLPGSPGLRRIDRRQFLIPLVPENLRLLLEVVHQHRTSLLAIVGSLVDAQVVGGLGGPGCRREKRDEAGRQEIVDSVTHESFLCEVPSVFYLVQSPLLISCRGRQEFWPPGLGLSPSPYLRRARRSSCGRTNRATAYAPARPEHEGSPLVLPGCR